MGDSGESLGVRLRSRWPADGAGVTAAVFVAASLLVGGAGGIAQAVAPTSVRADESPIVDPIGPRADAPLVLPEPLAHKEAAELTAVTSSWVPPAPRRSAGAGSAGGGSAGGGGGGGSAASGVLGYTNAARSANGLPGLAWNGTLAERSCAWAAHLAAVNGGLSHSANGGGFGWWGENVASGYGSASAVVNGWMGSPPHRENILRPQFTVMGSCSATSSTGVIYWVQQFGG
jgi:uncharacterized protein YkwD